jgi:hypothetical protein
MYVCMHVADLRIFTRMYAHYTGMYACMHPQIFTCVHAHTSTRQKNIQIKNNTCMCIRIQCWLTCEHTKNTLRLIKNHTCVHIHTWIPLRFTFPVPFPCICTHVHGCMHTYMSAIPVFFLQVDMCVTSLFFSCLHSYAHAYVHVYTKMYACH